MLTKRRTALGLLVCVTMGCGLELSGSLGGATGAADGGSSGQDGSTVSFDGSDIPVPSSDSGASDAKTSDGSTVVNSSLSTSSQNDPPDVDLTQQGTLDWAHWGTIFDGTPVRKLTGGAKISQFSLTNSSCDDNIGPSWPVFARWSDGAPTLGHTPTDLHRRIYGTNGTTVTLTAPCDNAERQFIIDFGGWSSQWRFEASFDNLPSGSNSATHGNMNGYYAVRYTITYVCPVGTRVVAKWIATNLPTSTICAGSDLILSSAWLR